ncbi:MAG TPA: imidazole glycerol phosphate synthase subunit HisH [Acidimicrobiales bacterium]|nr:imidazole glycerol phosphate synthase subunit HisH [Acidimicrobiales bacterium]
MTAPVVAVVDYGIGNLRSAAKALERGGADARPARDPRVIDAADGVVLPGVGAFGSCARALEASGLGPATLAAATGTRPFLGICVGMQLLYESSEESPGVPGLGVLGGRVRRLGGGLKVPHMQWNRVDVVGDGPLARALAGPPPWMYFVHSYAVPPGPEVVAVSDYGGPVVAAVSRGALWATQFHPEKSGRAGLALLGRFAAACAG